MPTLTASVAMRQALQKVAIRATRHAVHKSDTVSNFAPSFEVAKSDMAAPADPAVLASRRARNALSCGCVAWRRRCSPACRCR
jgi:hypothetical protein